MTDLLAARFTEAAPDEKVPDLGNRTDLGDRTFWFERDGKLLETDLGVSERLVGRVESLGVWSDFEALAVYLDNGWVVPCVRRAADKGYCICQVLTYRPYRAS